MTTPSLKDALTATLLRWLAVALQPYWPPHRPGPLTLTFTQVVTPMGLAFRASVQLPAPAVPEDVASRELVVTVNGTAGSPILVEPSAPSAPLGDFAVGDVLSVTLVDVDAAGNRSEPRTETATVSDTTPPPQPGEFAVAVEQVVS